MIKLCIFKLHGFHSRMTDTLICSCQLSTLQTIRYKPTETVTDEQGNTIEQEMTVEKQTTPDRLSKLPWDEEKTWLIIEGK